MLQLELSQFVILLVNLALTAVFGSITALANKHFKEAKARQEKEVARQQASMDGILSILLSYIFDAYTEHVILHHPMSYAKATIVEDTCLAYERMGGNGVAKKMIAKLRAETEIIIVGGDPDEYPHGHRGVDPID